MRFKSRKICYFLRFHVQLLQQLRSRPICGLPSNAWIFLGHLIYEDVKQIARLSSERFSPFRLWAKSIQIPTSSADSDWASSGRKCCGWRIAVSYDERFVCKRRPARRAERRTALRAPTRCTSVSRSSSETRSRQEFSLSTGCREFIFRTNVTRLPCWAFFHERITRGRHAHKQKPLPCCLLTQSRFHGEKWQSCFRSLLLITCWPSFRMYGKSPFLQWQTGKGVETVDIKHLFWAEGNRRTVCQMSFCSWHIRNEMPHEGSS